MHTIKISILFSILATFCLAQSAKAYYGDPYEAFVASAAGKCGVPDPYNQPYGGRLLKAGEHCTIVIRANEHLKNKLRYWVSFRKVGSTEFRKISPVYVFKNKSNKGFEFTRFAMKGVGEYRITFDSNFNGYPDSESYLGYFYKNN